MMNDIKWEILTAGDSVHVVNTNDPLSPCLDRNGNTGLVTSFFPTRNSAVIAIDRWKIKRIEQWKNERSIKKFNGTLGEFFSMLRQDPIKEPEVGCITPPEIFNALPEFKKKAGPDVEPFASKPQQKRTQPMSHWIKPDGHSKFKKVDSIQGTGPRPSRNVLLDKLEVNLNDLTGNAQAATVQTIVELINQLTTPTD